MRRGPFPTFVSVFALQSLPVLNNAGDENALATFKLIMENARTSKYTRARKTKLAIDQSRY